MNALLSLRMWIYCVVNGAYSSNDLVKDLLDVLQVALGNVVETHITRDRTKHQVIWLSHPNNTTTQINGSDGFTYPNLNPFFKFSQTHHHIITNILINSHTHTLTITFPCYQSWTMNWCQIVHSCVLISSCDPSSPWMSRWPVIVTPHHSNPIGSCFPPTSVFGSWAAHPDSSTWAHPTTAESRWVDCTRKWTERHWSWIPA